MEHGRNLLDHLDQNEYRSIALCLRKEWRARIFPLRRLTISLLFPRGKIMGTDFLMLFNKSLADRIIKMDKNGLSRYVEKNLYILKEKNKDHVTRWGFSGV